MARARSAGRRPRSAPPPEGALPSGRHGLDRGEVQRIQRARLVRALVQIVCEHGVQGLSVAEVVSRAGVSRRTFYEQFSGNEECFLAAFDDSVQRIVARVAPAYEGQRRWQDRVRAGLLALLEFLDEDPCTGRLVFVEALGAGPRALERRTHVLDRLAAAVDEGRVTARAQGMPPPPPLAAEGAVGAVCAVLHARLLARESTPLVRSANALMSMIVLPYLGPAATRAELRRPAPRARPKAAAPESDGDLLKELGMRITYRTLRVLQSVGSNPGASNRQVGEHAGIVDQGQISKLLHRLQRLGLIENGGEDAEKGAPNAWLLTARGEAVGRAIGAGPFSPAAPGSPGRARRSSRGSPPSAPPRR